MQPTNSTEETPVPAAARHPDSSLSRSLPPWYLAILVGLLALLPRCLSLNDFFTVDESFHWVWRVMHFSDAMEKGNWAGTNLTGHPGLTTLWLGSVGRKVAFAAGLTGPEWEKGSAAYLALLRLPIAATTSLAVALGYLVLRRLLRPSPAFLAALLWAWSPFLIAHSRLLHLDGLLTSFMSLSVLLLLLAEGNGQQARPLTSGWGGLAGSGVCAGLAFLTKAPSLVLLPMIGLLLLALAPGARGRRWLWYVVVRYALWLLCAVLVFFAGWPALWVESGAAIGRVMNEVLANGAQPHESGNYFLGRPVADPGPFFYPVVVLWRGTPVLLVGLFLLPLAIKHHSNERRMLLALGGFVLLFGLAMTILPKKFDRYLLPVWPALTVLAAAGLSALPHLRLARRVWSPVQERLDRTRKLLRLPAVSPRPLALLLIAVLLLLPNLWYHPYYLSYFNPLVGGGISAPQVLLVGWGEGMEQVGAWLRGRPDLHRSPVLSWDPRTLEPFVPVRVVELNEITLEKPASYAVLYVRGVQRESHAAALAQVRQTPPLYTLRMYGIEYARVYQPMRPFTKPVGAIFAGGEQGREPVSHREGLHLRGYSQERTATSLTITLSWEVQADMPGGLFCFVHVLDAADRRVAQVDALIDEGYFARWQAGQQFGGPLPIVLPPNLPAGTYRVVLGVYRPHDGTRLPLVRGGIQLPPSVDGPHTLLLTQFTHR
jgi:hypothetical protein